MADRTDGEREAARLERERRRAARAGGEPAPPPAAAEPPPSFEPALPQTDAGPATQPMQLEFAGDDHHEDEPSGTRRISGLERMSDRSRRRTGRVGQAKLPLRHGHRSIRKRVGAGIALIVAAALIWFLFELFQPFYGSPHGKLFEVTIPRGSNASQIGDLLERKGVISSSFFFNLRATLDGDRGDLRAGTFKLRYGMSYSTVLTVLTTAPKPVPTSELTLIPGKTRLQVDKLLNSQGISGSYVAATRHSPLLDPHSYGAPRSTPDLEGFLFPDTYQLRKPIRIVDLIADQLKQFKYEFATIKLGYARSKRLTPYDVLIIASMVETEAATAHDRPLVASVIYNRLRLGMPLQIDATTRYATGNYTKPLTNSELNSSSPYNTRIRPGLPPTPIDSPGLASIQAAAHPASTNDLYFVVKPCGNGEMTFTGSYATFLQDQAAYNNARNARGGNSPENCKG
jgi:UPF0755 protein